ncbi:MAG: (2Fe-2S)-binding protein [Armatimonadetes bacterium]|nr:(2Fe-2S)-binding protein [Armatimonadota bacterium]
MGGSPEGRATGEAARATRSRLLCRCREVSEEEVLQAIREGARSLRGVKVRTRAMTGLRQGQTCGPLIEALLRRELGADLLPHDRPERGPVRPLPVHVLASAHTPPLRRAPLSGTERGRG